MSFDRDAWVSEVHPDLAPRALDLRDRIVAAEAECVPGIETDDGIGINLSIFLDGHCAGCATLDAEGLSFYVEGGGHADSGSDDALVEAVRNAVAARREG